MSHITRISIKNYRGIKELTQEFGKEKFVVLIGRGDSGKSTILSAIYAALSPSWNMMFSDLDFYKQDTDNPIEIEVTLNELPIELLKESKFGLYIQTDPFEEVKQEDMSIIIKLTVDSTFEPHWVVKARKNSDMEDKAISGADRLLLAINFITDCTDNQFAYNKQSPLYTLAKLQMKDGNTVEKVKSKLMRSLSESIKKEQLESFNKPLENFKNIAEKLGLNVNNLRAQIDIQEDSYTGNSITLHDNSIPYRLKGKGSKRLMSIAIQSELVEHGGIVLIDELEQGLEPDRIITLVRMLNDTTEGQVFITTHSLNVVLESEWHNIFIVNKGAKSLFVLDKELDTCRRTNPEFLFAKKIICCQGKKEFTFINGLDTLAREKYNTSFLAKGVIVLNAGSRVKMFTYTDKLKYLGYDTCMFSDEDTPEEPKETPEAEYSGSLFPSEDKETESKDKKEDIDALLRWCDIDV